ncbi:MAG: YdeI/OmpD-associated family protein [Bacteroidia bacterium]|jgi:hypothetical protein|nr:YdeI/OmpD-associated family protein [Bacteroidia bacterium]
MAIQFELKKFDSGMHYILLDAKTVKTLTKGNNKRAICRLNNAVEFHCAMMPKKEGGYYINIGSAICKKLKLREGVVVSAQFTVDEAEYQFEMPEELKAVLDTDSKANAVFHALTEGNQRGLMYLVSQVKSSDKRIERALKIASKIKDGITSPRVILK